MSPTNGDVILAAFLLEQEHTWLELRVHGRSFREYMRYGDWRCNASVIGPANNREAKALSTALQRHVGERRRSAVEKVKMLSYCLN